MSVIINHSRLSILANRAEVATTPRDRVLGLLRVDKLQTGQGLIIPRCDAIHTIGMTFDIDVIFADLYSGFVLKLIPNAPPGHHWAVFDFHKFEPENCVAIELPAGTIALTGTQFGDVLQFFL